MEEHFYDNDGLQVINVAYVEKTYLEFPLARCIF
jgi:hypothetical protein